MKTCVFLVETRAAATYRLISNLNNILILFLVEMVFSRANPLISTILDKNIYLNERCVVYLDSTVIIIMCSGEKKLVILEFPPPMFYHLSKMVDYIWFFFLQQICPGKVIYRQVLQEFKSSLNIDIVIKTKLAYYAPYIMAHNYSIPSH